MRNHVHSLINVFVACYLNHYEYLSCHIMLNVLMSATTVSSLKVMRFIFFVDN